MKVRIMSRLMSAFAALLAFASFAAPEIVSKDIGDPEMNGWTHVEKLVVRTLDETGTEPVVVPAY
jgi:CheY-like chemotaxis protein